MRDGHVGLCPSLYLDFVSHDALELTSNESCLTRFGELGGTFTPHSGGQSAGGEE